jgi:hypothetical protein
MMSGQTLPSRHQSTVRTYVPPVPVVSLNPMLTGICHGEANEKAGVHRGFRCGGNVAARG